MDIIFSGLKEALVLIFSFDAELFEVVFLSLRVSFSALLIAGFIAVPLSFVLARKEFRLKGLLLRLIYTFMGMPPVLCGLLLYLIFMRRGPFGFLGLNYSVTIMIIAQTLLIIPIMMGTLIEAISKKQDVIKNLAYTLGADKRQTFILLLRELRFSIYLAFVMGLSRALSEVGAVMVVGGNIKGKTRVMTTYISELKGMGDFERAIATGMILLLIAFLTNTVFYHLQRRIESGH